MKTDKRFLDMILDPLDKGNQSAIGQKRSVDEATAGPSKSAKVAPRSDPGPIANADLKRVHRFLGSGYVEMESKTLKAYDWRMNLIEL